MKKKTPLTTFAFVLIFFAASIILTIAVSRPASGKMDTTTEDAGLNNSNGSGDLMIWESLSRHFMAFN